MRESVLCLILLDLTAVFYIVDYSVLIDTLYRWVGVSGMELNCFGTYLSNRTSVLSVGDDLSSPSTIVVFHRAP